MRCSDCCAIDGFQLRDETGVLVLKVAQKLWLMHVLQNNRVIFRKDFFLFYSVHQLAAMKSGENHLYEGLLTFGNLYIA